jgi:hypothetical protein
MSAAAPREWHQEPVVGRIDNSIRRAVLIEPSSWGFRSRGVRAEARLVQGSTVM